MLELARESDWEAVKRISVQIHDLHAAWRPDLYVHTEEPYPKKKFLEDIVNRLVYVQKFESLVVGYVVVSVMNYSGPGTVTYKAMKIDSICVDEMFRRQGLGRSIIEGARALAKVFGCREVHLGVHPENDGAVAFYQKCGFHIRTIRMDMRI